MGEERPMSERVSPIEAVAKALYDRGSSRALGLEFGPSHPHYDFWKDLAREALLALADAVDERMVEGGNGVLRRIGFEVDHPEGRAITRDLVASALRAAAEKEMQDG